MIISNGSIYYKKSSFTKNARVYNIWHKCSSSGVLETKSYTPGTTECAKILMVSDILPAGFTEYVAPTTPVNICNLVLVWDNGRFTAEQVGGSTRFRIYVSGGGSNIIQFRHKQNAWIDANMGIDTPDGAEFLIVNTGECHEFHARVKGCSGDGIPGCYLDFAVAPSTPGTPVAPTPTTPVTPTPVTPITPGDEPTNQIVPIVMESGNNTFNFMQFSPFDLPSGHKFSMGSGSPVFSNWQGSGLLSIFSRGVTNFQHTSAFLETEAPSRMASIIVAYYGLLRQAAMGIVGQHPEVQPIIDWVNRFECLNSGGSDCGPYVSINWSDWSTEVNRKLGYGIADARNSQPQYNTGEFNYWRSTHGAFWLVDEEVLPEDNHGYRHYSDAFSAMNERYPNSIFNFYGKRWNGWYLLNNLENYPCGYDTSQIGGFRDGAQYPWYSFGFKDGNLTIDVSPGYPRVPLVMQNIYQVDIYGNYILESGKRKFRTDNFIEVIFGRKTPILAQATQAVRRHANWGPMNRHDLYWLFDALYRFYDYMAYAQLGRVRGEYPGSDYDTSVYHNFKIKCAMTLRPVCEPWTHGSNSHWIRELGPEYLKYLMLFGWFTGLDYIETWDDGTENGLSHATSPNYRRIKPEGTPLYPGRIDPYYWYEENYIPNFWNGGVPLRDYWNQNPNYTSNEGGTDNVNGHGDDNFSRYTTLIGANASFAKAFAVNGFNYSDPSFRRLWFNIPIYAYRNKEILAQGIYQGTRLALVMFYPYHNTGDSTDVEISFNGTLLNFKLVSGRYVKMFFFNVPAGISPSQITIKYNNIDGNLIWANAVNKGIKAGKYLSEPVSQC